MEIAIDVPDRDRAARHLLVRMAFWRAMPPAPKRRKRAAPIPRKAPSQPRAAHTVDAIVTAVERVLERHGIDGLNTNRIAEIAGVSVGTLYQYFPNKESLVAALHDRYLQLTLTMCRAVLSAAEGIPFPDIIDRMATAMLVAYAGQRPIHRALVELRTVAAVQQRRREAHDELVDELAAFLAKRSDLQLADPRAAAFVLVHCVEGVTSAATTRAGAVDVPSIVEATRQLLRPYGRVASD